MLRGVGAFFAHELRLVAVALQFLTRVPVRLSTFEPAWLAASARHFPLVGAGVGVCGAAVLAAAAALWPTPLAVALSMAATVLRTGAVHEDGLADTCDGLGGAVCRERALAIMKDSRIGSYGALGLVLTLGLKAAALGVLAQRSLPAAALALVLAHAASRACAVGLLAALPYAGDPAQAKSPAMARRPGAGASAMALGWGALVAMTVALSAVDGVAPARVALACAAAAAVGLVCRRWFRRRLGGVTGDTLGAAQQWSELAVYLALAAAPGSIFGG